MKILLTALTDVPDVEAASTPRDRIEAVLRNRLHWDGCAIEALAATAHDPAPRPDFTATDVGTPPRTGANAGGNRE